MMSQLRDAYNAISSDYLSKKSAPWRDFVSFYRRVDWHHVDTVVDIGGGNGRNLNPIQAKYHILLDFSEKLLRGYCGPVNGDRIAGALPHLPLRKDCCSHSLLIAVLHHFKSRETAKNALNDVSRITREASILSVWRKWRRGHREKIFQALRTDQPIDPLVNHDRPWKSSSGACEAIRFYHYYTFRELFHEITESGMSINHMDYLGGKFGDANIFVETV